MLPISVIIPTHNRREKVQLAVRSVLDQSQPPQEIIVVDDGSCDGTSEELKRTFGSQIKLLHQENRGVSSARNKGIAAATQPWIAFLDSDDEWLPKKLTRQWEEQEGTELRFVHCDEIWIRNGRRVNPMNKHQKYGGRIFKQCLPLCCVSPSAVLLHRSLFEEFGNFDEELPACEDYDLWLRICSHEEVLFVDEALLKKTGGHEDQLSRRYWGMDRFRIRALERLLQQDARSLSREEEALALKTLNKKISVFLGGAKKRERNEDILLYSEKLTRWSEKLQQLKAKS